MLVLSFSSHHVDKNVHEDARLGYNGNGNERGNMSGDDGDKGDNISVDDGRRGFRSQYTSPS